MTTKENPRRPNIVIIGAGMTGILMVIKLREAGITDITILEKSDNLGGTWRENTYPGVACDIPSHLYTYSFEINPEWSNFYAKGAEIQDYFEKVGRKYGVTEKVCFNESVISSIYDRGKWTVKTSKGNTIVSDFVINCTGILHHPAKPDIAGINSFKGKVFHTAEWDHNADLSDKKIGVIGTGSTASQMIPELAKTANNLSVFQRTPQWIFPLGDKKYSEKDKESFRDNPAKLHRLRKAYAFGLQQGLTKAVIGAKFQNTVFSLMCKLNLRFSVKDPELRAKLTPDYKVGCKRIVINTTFYDAVQQDHVDLVTEGIEQITPEGVMTRNGKLHKLDVLILSTGFNPTAYMRPMDVQGKEGLKINDAWSKKIQAYRSMFLPGFPNFFLMLGPNTPIGNYSVIEMSEVQCDYLIKVINRWQANEFDEIDTNKTAFTEFNEYLHKGMKKTVWKGGCQSWYLDSDGDPIVWPYSWAQWTNEMSEPKMADFDTQRFE